MNTIETKRRNNTLQTFGTYINEAYNAETLPNARTSYDGKIAFDYFGQTLYYYTQRSFNVVARYIIDGDGNDVYTYVGESTPEDYTGQQAFIDMLRRDEHEQEKRDKYKKQTRTILKNKHKQTGGTFESDETNGYYVGLEGAELDLAAETNTRGELDHGRVFEIVNDNLALLNFKLKNKYSNRLQNNVNAYYIGWWVDNGILYLDITAHTNDKQTAIELAKQHKQLAIYNIELKATEYMN